MKRRLVVSCFFILYSCLSLATKADVLPDPNVNVSQLDLWGTYRPQAYFGMRAKIPNSLQFGFIWYVASVEDDFEKLRNYVSDGSDGVSSFGWPIHNGRDYGYETIEEANNGFRLHFEWIKEEGLGIGIRVRGEALSSEVDISDKKISLLSYLFVSQDDTVSQRLKRLANNITHETDNTPSLGHIKLLSKMESHGRGYQEAVCWSGYTQSNGHFYAVYQAPNSKISHSTRNSRRERLRKGVNTRMTEQELSYAHAMSLSLPFSESWKYESLIKELLLKERQFQEKENDAWDLAPDDIDGGPLYDAKFVPLLKDYIEESATVTIAQRILVLPFEVDFVFIPVTSSVDDRKDCRTSSVTALSGNELTKKFRQKRKQFDDRFNQKYQLEKKGYSAEWIQIAKYALSNSLGGIGFFHGSTLLNIHIEDSSMAENIKDAVLPSVSLLTSTPARHSFARGFLWDEGFHQLLISSWDSLLSLECLESWLSTCTESGWIPREQALGDEVRSLFPPHVRQFIMQDPNIANPPTLVLPLRALAKQILESKGFVLNESTVSPTLFSNVEPFLCGHQFWKDASERLLRVLEWFEKTQTSISLNGQKAGFRWVGRSTAKVASDGNMLLTFASGLDDYPRAIVPNNGERHLDLHCWITWAWDAITDIFQCSSSNNSFTEIRDKFNRLLSMLELFHRPTNNVQDKASSSNLLCDYDGMGQHICHEGYVALFPLALGSLPVDSPYVYPILEMMKDDSKLHSGYGLRSLSRSDPFYQKGDNYWTGPVWIPINYLVLAALHEKYAKQEGPYQKFAQSVYATLREELVSNVIKEYQRTGFFWEQYSDVDGHGQRTKGFTGWSSLIVLIMAEKYYGVV
eukprot:jgi/Galph1/46/GphlegSOOS_G4773.1